MSGTFWTIEQVEPIIKERKELRQRVAELECQLVANRSAYKERGERMKEMRRVIIAGCGLVDPYRMWFDPETGEPL